MLDMFALAHPSRGCIVWENCLSYLAYGFVEKAEDIQQGAMTVKAVYGMTEVDSVDSINDHLEVWSMRRKCNQSDSVMK